MDILRRPFIGSEAIVAGLVCKHELRSQYTSLFPDVYVHPDVEVSLADRARGAWLWSHREGVVAGLTASGIHGAKWVDEDLPIELIWPNARPPKGMRTYDYRLTEDEYLDLDGMRLCTPERVAFDLARRDSVGQAVARLDSLARATRFKVEDVQTVAARHPHVKGLRRVDRILDLIDSGAESPQETFLRLLLIADGFPRPETQIPVTGPDGMSRYYLDMGWKDLMVAVEYDGEHHRTDSASYRNDIIRLEYLHAVGWIVVRVIKSHRRASIVRRVQDARSLRLR